MQRVTISVDDVLAEEFDALSLARGYQSRSEAVRDLIRTAVKDRRISDDNGRCVANLSYIYNHHTRLLAMRLIEMQFEHRDLVLATTHVHLDHENCLETVMLKGAVDQVRAFADEIQAERGVRYAALNIVPVEPAQDHHATDAHPHHHGAEAHLSPRVG
jgi:CopG family nickel-responsive transcriptional regulator